MFRKRCDGVRPFTEQSTNRTWIIKCKGKRSTVSIAFITLIRFVYNEMKCKGAKTKHCGTPDCKLYRSPTRDRSGTVSLHLFGLKVQQSNVTLCHHHILINTVFCGLRHCVESTFLLFCIDLTAPCGYLLFSNCLYSNILTSCLRWLLYFFFFLKLSCAL